MNKFLKSGVLKEVNGNVVSPHGGGLKLVLSTATTHGGLDCPTIPLLSKKWAKVRENLFKINSYRTTEYGLGYVSDLSVQSDVWIMHLMCRDKDGALSADGLKKCLAAVCKTAKYEKASVHIAKVLLDTYPEFIELLKPEFLDHGIDVLIYSN